MIGLFDRDVFFKLCCCNLWFEANECLGISQPFRLAATSNNNSNHSKITRMLAGVDPTDAILRTRHIVNAVPVLSDELVDKIYASDIFGQLSNVEGIDGGEQILTAILINNPAGKVLLSGDKRYISALRIQMPDTWEALSGAVISFEQCLLAILLRYNFEYVIERVHPVRHCDGTLKIAVGHEPNRASFIEALTSYDPCRGP